MRYGLIVTADQAARGRTPGEWQRRNTDAWYPPICFDGTRQIAQIRALAPHEPASHANAILDDFGEF